MGSQIPIKDLYFEKSCSLQPTGIDFLILLYTPSIFTPMQLLYNACLLYYLIGLLHMENIGNSPQHMS